MNSSLKLIHSKSTDTIWVWHKCFLSCKTYFLASISGRNPKTRLRTTTVVADNILCPNVSMLTPGNTWTDHTCYLCSHVTLLRMPCCLCLETLQIGKYQLDPDCNLVVSTGSKYKWNYKSRLTLIGLGDFHLWRNRKKTKMVHLQKYYPYWCDPPMLVMSMQHMQLCHHAVTVAGICCVWPKLSHLWLDKFI